MTAAAKSKRLSRVPMSTLTVLICGVLLAASSGRQDDLISLRDECLQTLMLLTNTLIDLQVKDKANPDFGAIACPETGIFHTRAAEAVYPFAVAYKHTGEQRYLQAAIRVINWLIQQQEPGGEWQETPWTWTGTTTDQLLMMACAFTILEDHLTDTERETWKQSMKRAGDFLVEKMSPDFASINYCPTTAATLMMTNRILPDERYSKKAKELAHQVLAKMDEDGFITGEAARALGVKYGVDLGYQIDMSLWGLALYARFNNDTLVAHYVRKSLKNVLNFVYPDGIIDGSWGARCYKWTTYGSKTADGCQILFSLYAPEDARYRTAAIRNLRYLRKMIKDGLIGYGPRFWDLPLGAPCIYPTFVRAKNLALAVEFGEQGNGATPSLPNDEPGLVSVFPTVDVAVARSKNFLTTISAYRYKDALNWGNGKYTHRPSGGSMCNLWVEGHGLLQTSSQTRYIRGEEMHMPALEDSIICLTPRIEFRNADGYFTNLYECEGRLSAASDGAATAVVSTTGELSNERYLPGGVAYILSHAVHNDFVEKSVRLRYHDRRPEIRIVEPIVQQPGMRFEQIDSCTVAIRGGKREFRFELTSGNAEIELGENEAHYWYPFPSVKCYPVVLKVLPPEQFFLQDLTYRISVVR